MKKILLIEHDASLLTMLRDNLEQEGITLTASRSGKGALALCRQLRPDLILLEMALPDGSGLDICKAVRADPDMGGTPIIFLTGRALEVDRVLALEMGANDYIVKPFFVRELIARIKLQFRNPAVPPRFLESGGLQLDRGACRVHRNGVLLDLTATEFRLLEVLMSQPGIVFRREQLLNSVWGHRRAITEGSVYVYVTRLRQKIEIDPANPVYIHAVRGFGYTFEPRVLKPTMVFGEALSKVS